METVENSGKRTGVFRSRALNAAEQRYPAHGRELLAAMDILRVWRVYLNGQKFTVCMDVFSIHYLHSQPHSSQKQVRWLERVVEFDVILQPIKG